MGFKRLEKNLIDIIKEEQAKLGFRKEEIRLYYPLISLNHFFEADDDVDEMQTRLEQFPEEVKKKLGDICVTHKKDRFCLHIPEQGSVYVHEHMAENEFIKKLVELMMNHGIKKEDIIPFAGNVNPLGISPLLKKSMASHIESISEYPDRDYKELRSTLALYCNVPMEHIIVGNGATEMISLTMQLLRPKHALLLSPTYSEYTREIDLVGGHVEEYFLREDLDFKLDLNDLISKLTDDIDLLAICNPNNPTSSALNTEEITKILTHCKLHDIFVMIDETYVEFAPDIDTISAVSLTTKFDNFMILRGTSKFFCAPGLRLGYGICGNLAFLERMNSIKNPWTINTLAALAGEAMFMDTDYIQITKDYIQSERTRCIDILSKRDNLKIYPAYANFILVKLLDGTTSFEMFERCIKSGLMIRDCASFHGLDGEFIRFCIQKKEDNDRLLNLLTL